MYKGGSISLNLAVDAWDWLGFFGPDFAFWQGFRHLGECRVDLEQTVLKSKFGECLLCISLGMKTKKATPKGGFWLVVLAGGARPRFHIVAVGCVGVVCRKPLQALAVRVFHPLGGDSHPPDSGLLILGEEHGLNHASPIGEGHMLNFGHFGPPSRLGVVIGTSIQA